MKIGILTLHNNRNKGSLLQNYCLVQAIETILPNTTVETVDYRCFSHEFKRLKNSYITKHIGAIPPRVKDLLLSEQFLRDYCNLSSRRLISDKYNKSVSFINRLEYDILIFGSDTIWKIRPNKNSFFSGERPFPNLYFGGEELHSTKIAYAASANKTDLSLLNRNQLDHMRTSLNDFSAIGVRDDFTEEMLSTLDVNHYNRVPDPTFVTDIPNSITTIEDQFDSLSTDKPILGINAPKHKFISKIADRFRNDGYVIVCPNASPYADINLVGKVNPFEYYTIHSIFDFMVTNSLHSTIFCLQHHTPFLTVDLDEEYAQFSSSKTESLLKEFELIDRHKKIYSNDNININTEEYLTMSSTEMNQIDRILDSHTTKGLTFLEDNLNNYQ